MICLVFLKQTKFCFLKGTTCLYFNVYMQRGVLFACAKHCGPTVTVKEAWLSCAPVPHSLLLTSPGFELMRFCLLCFVLLHCGETQTASLALEWGQERGEVVFECPNNCEV